jgi:predicted transcriptional regulator
MQKKDLPSLFLQSPKHNQLNILREVAVDAHITQAELGTRCALSVAMVNNYMKELCRTGLIEYHRKTIKSVTYYLTPAGSAQLEILQHELTRDMVEMFVASQEHVLARIMSQAPEGLRRVILYGSGHLAQLVFHALEMAHMNILGVCDDDLDLIGSDFCGREVMSFSQVRFLSPEAVIVARAPQTEEASRGMESLVDQGIKIVHVGCPALPKSAGRAEVQLPVVLPNQTAGRNAALPLHRSGNR